MNAQMFEGMCDGTYKSLNINWAGLTSDDERLRRAHLTLLNAGGNGYGVFEAPVKRTPDGRFARDKGREAPGIAEG